MDIRLVILLSTTSGGVALSFSLEVERDLGVALSFAGPVGVAAFFLDFFFKDSSRSLLKSL